MSRITRSFSPIITSDVVTHIAERLANLGLPVVDISENHGEVIFTAANDAGLVLGTTNYIPNATGDGRSIIFGSRSGVFTANDVYRELCNIRNEI